MDPITICAVVLVIGWALRRAAEDGWAVVRGQESPAIARRRAHLQIDREHSAATGRPTRQQALDGALQALLGVLAAVAGRAAHRIANPPAERPALEYVRLLWGDAWEDATRRHSIARRARQRAEEEGRTGTWPWPPHPHPDDIVDAEVVDRPRCSTCDRVEVDTDGDRCPACRWVAPDPTPSPDPDEQDPGPDPFGAPEPHQPTTGWRETTGGAERTGGDAWYRRWVQPHPRGDGTLRTTVTSWVEDDGQRRWIVTETEWRWVSDEDTRPHRVLFEDYAMSASRPGPSGEPWPTPDDVRRHVDDANPAAPDETPLADVLDASLCLGGCGTWVVGGMCDRCETRRALPAPETPEPAGSGQHDPAPDQGPASTTQHSTHSGSAAYQGGTPVSQPAYINPDVVDATGALRCAAGAAVFTGAARHQMEMLGANAQAGLGDVPAAHAIRAFEADIAACLVTINGLVEEHVEHVRTQAELAQDRNLANAAVGYLAARHRA